MEARDIKAELSEMCEFCEQPFCIHGKCDLCDNCDECFPESELAEAS